ncbi:MAG TPA: DUF6763 family protein [Steroidobacteraceae bacterium]
MITKPKLPEIGQWYTHRDEGEVFQVAGYDDRSQTIEIQSFDGDIRAQVPFDLVRQAVASFSAVTPRVPKPANIAVVFVESMRTCKALPAPSATTSRILQESSGNPSRSRSTASSRWAI